MNTKIPKVSPRCTHPRCLGDHHLHPLTSKTDPEAALGPSRLGSGPPISSHSVHVLQNTSMRPVTVLLLEADRRGSDLLHYLMTKAAAPLQTPFLQTRLSGVQGRADARGHMSSCVPVKLQTAPAAPSPQPSPHPAPDHGGSGKHGRSVCTVRFLQSPHPSSHITRPTRCTLPHLGSTSAPALPSEPCKPSCPGNPNPGGQWCQTGDGSSGKQFFCASVGRGNHHFPCSSFCVARDTLKRSRKKARTAVHQRQVRTVLSSSGRKAVLQLRGQPSDSFPRGLHGITCTREGRSPDVPGRVTSTIQLPGSALKFRVTRTTAQEADAQPAERGWDIRVSNTPAGMPNTLLSLIGVLVTLWVSRAHGQETTCDPPTLTNGLYTPLRTKYRPEDVITYHCVNGFSPSSRGNKTRCTEGGWTPPPRCIHPCVISEEILNENNIRLKGKEDKTYYAKTGDIMEFTCKAGHSAATSGQSFAAMCREGTVQLPRCE
ncbi:uncharacterized protein AAES06_002743 [Glossophaga mutica]